VAGHVDWGETIGTEEESAARGLHQPLQTRPHLPRKALCKPRDATAGVSERREHRVSATRVRRVVSKRNGGCTSFGYGRGGGAEQQLFVLGIAQCLKEIERGGWVGEGEFVRTDTSAQRVLPRCGPLQAQKQERP